MWYGNEEFSWFNAFIIFISDLLFFILSTIAVKRITAGLILKTAIYTGVVSICAFTSQFFAVKNFFYIIPACLSGIFGASIAMFYERKKRRKTELKLVVPFSRESTAQKK